MNVLPIEQTDPELASLLIWFCSEQGQHDMQDALSIKKIWAQTGRNDPCPCGSGTKYKKCCG